MKSTGSTLEAHLCLVIESKKRIASDFNRDASSFGLKSYQVGTFESAREILRLWRFDGIVLDAPAFGPHVLQMLPELRPRWRTPLVLLAEKCGEEDQLAGLACGATDVMPRPASTLLIATKVRQLIEMRRMHPPDPLVDIRVGGLVLQQTSMGAFVNDHPMELTPHEFKLLTLLALREGSTVSRDAISALLGGALQADPRSVDVHICHLRKRLADAGDCGMALKTVRGRGYRLEAQAQAFLRR